MNMPSFRCTFIEPGREPQYVWIVNIMVNLVVGIVSFRLM